MAEPLLSYGLRHGTASFGPDQVQWGTRLEAHTTRHVQARPGWATLRSQLPPADLGTQRFRGSSLATRLPWRIGTHSLVLCTGSTPLPISNRGSGYGPIQWVRLGSFRFARASLCACACLHVGRFHQPTSSFRSLQLLQFIHFRSATCGTTSRYV